MQMRSDSDSDAQSDSLPISEDELGDQPDVPSIFDLSLSRAKDFRAYAHASKLDHQSIDPVVCTVIEFRARFFELLLLKLKGGKGVRF